MKLFEQTHEDATPYPPIVEIPLTNVGWAGLGRREFRNWDRPYFELTEDGLTISERVIFITLVAGGGLKPEGSQMGWYFTTQEQAEDAMDETIKRYVADRVGHIHWRRRPEARSETFYRYEFGQLEPQRFWVATCRLAVHPFTPEPV